MRYRYKWVYGMSMLFDLAMAGAWLFGVRTKLGDFAFASYLMAAVFVGLAIREIHWYRKETKS